MYDYTATLHDLVSILRELLEDGHAAAELVWDDWRERALARLRARVVPDIAAAAKAVSRWHTRDAHRARVVNIKERAARAPHEAPSRCAPGPWRSAGPRAATPVGRS